MSTEAGATGGAPQPRIETEEFDPSTVEVPPGWQVVPIPGPAPLSPQQRAESARVLADDAAAYADAVAARLEKYRGTHGDTVIDALSAELEDARAAADQAADEAADAEAAAAAEGSPS